MPNIPAANFQEAFHLLLAALSPQLPLIISSFAKHSNLSIRVVLTKSAAHSLAGQSPEQPTMASLTSLLHVDSVHLDEGSSRGRLQSFLRRQ